MFENDLYVSSGSTLARAEEDVATPTDTEDVIKPYVPPEGAEKYGFQAEVHRMLDIVVNSLYQHKDVFLRELISNASDALDKIRYLLLTDPDKYTVDGEEIPLKVEIEYDPVNETITIRDTGVGMTHDEMVANLGTVARSGTTKFMEALKESGNAAETVGQIGQFGVGFYSTFLVASRVTVASKSPLDPVQHVWESSNGSGDFFIYSDPRGNTLKRGTEITLYLKEDESHYADAAKVKQLAKHYSEFVVHPINVRVSETIMVDDDEDEADSATEEKKDEDDLEVKDDDEEEAKPKEKKKKEVTTHTWELVNGDPAIWTRDKDEVSDDEYQAFYKTLTASEMEKAATWSHFNAEGNINFKSILYLPDDVPQGYKSGSMDPIKGAVKLYVRKVLIGDDFSFLPKYLGFIRGVVDSDELTLNVNRETLQEEKTLKVIRKKVVKKAVDLIVQFAKESEKKVDDDSAEDDDDEKKEKKDDDDGAESKYIQWYKKFSPNIKLGIIEDYGNRNKLIKLLRYETSKSNGKLVSLAEYAKNMKDWQKDVYVLGCANVQECTASPFLESFKEKDVEVLFMTDALDEYMMKNVYDFDKKRLVQISSENVKLGDEDPDMIKRREKVYSKKFAPLTKYLKTLYGGNILRVQVAKRSLGSVPAIVTSTEYGNTANMERIMKAQAYNYGADLSQVNAMKVFELNPRHPLVLKLLDSVPVDDLDDKTVSSEIVDAAWMIYDMAMLNGGFSIPSPEEHAKRIVKSLQGALSIDSLSLEPEIHPPVEEDVPPEAAEEEENLDAGMDDLPLKDPIDPNNINIQQLKDQFPDAGWPEEKKTGKKKPKQEEDHEEL
jgi:heat shock protein 90kDa beta